MDWPWTMKRRDCIGQTPACKIWKIPLLKCVLSFVCYTIKLLLLSLFCSAIRQKIERSSLTGANREVIVSTAIYPFAMTMFGQFIYWTDWNTRSIYRANKHDGSDQRLMIQNLPSRPMDIHVLASRKQQQCDSPCQQFNGGCSHICTPGTTSFMPSLLHNIPLSAVFVTLNHLCRTQRSWVSVPIRGPLVPGWQQALYPRQWDSLPARPVYLYEWPLYSCPVEMWQWQRLWRWQRWVGESLWWVVPKREFELI